MAFLSNAQISDLCLKLATLLHAGIGPGQAGSFMKSGDPEVISVVKSIADGDDRGEKLYESMASTGKFPPYAVGLLETGDMSGRTEEALMALSAYYDRQSARSAQVKSALLYPALLVLLMLAVIVVLLVKVLPVFDAVYASLGGSMEGIAAGLLAAGEMIGTAMPFACALMALAVLFLAFFAGSVSFRERVIGAYKARFGDKGVSRKLNDAKLAQAMAMGLASGMRLEDAVRLAGNLTGDVPAAKARCEKCAADLASQADLRDALSGSGILPEQSCELLALAQQAGSADAAMEETARRLSREADMALDGLIAKVEPAMVLVTSLLVGMILVAVMLPLMNIMSAIG